MNSSSTLLTNISFSCFATQLKEYSPNRGQFQLRLKKKSEAKLSVKCTQISDSVIYSSPPQKFNLRKPSPSVSQAAMTCEVVDKKLERLVLEFESLTQSIDRVKRLLHYAARLPPFDESARVEANRVTGCTTQVWLEARLDESGRVRFCADSDSEITKGFISCLIWILDGAEPEEVLMVKAEDLGAMNVGLHGKAQSRVNTWLNVLNSMQKRTMALVVDSQVEPPELEPFPSLVGIVDNIGADERFNEAEIVADAGVKIAESGCQLITVLATDLDSEMGIESGFAKVLSGVHIYAKGLIGCKHGTFVELLLLAKTEIPQKKRSSEIRSCTQ